MRVVLQDIRSAYDGYAMLARLAEEVRNVAFGRIDVDMSRVAWFDANMCAPLGAILYRSGAAPNAVNLSGLRGQVEAILTKNGFLENYGKAARKDTFGTTIRYLRLEPKDDRYFGRYIERELVGKGILPKMSPGLSKRFREGIFEVFSNAALHSQTKLGIYSCGQFYPKKHQVDFCIADLGVGMRQRVMDALGLNMTSVQAIDWAMSGRNTVKTGPIPGGLGLKLLREFVALNQGRIQIASDSGYWELASGQVAQQDLPAQFPGTVVNIEINTADTRSYWLTSEARAENVF